MPWVSPYYVAKWKVWASRKLPTCLVLFSKDTEEGWIMKPGPKQGGSAHLGHIAQPDSVDRLPGENAEEQGCGMGLRDDVTSGSVGISC